MREYLRVSTEIDCTGSMHPKSITWKDGRKFKIDAIEEFRPACSPNGTIKNTDCYSVVISGQERHLYFERLDPMFRGRLGRWYVEVNK